MGTLLQLWDKHFLFYKIYLFAVEQWCAPSSRPWRRPSLLSLAVWQSCRPVVPFLFCRSHPAEQPQFTFNWYKKRDGPHICIGRAKAYFGSKRMKVKLTWKNCSSFSRLQKKGRLRTLSAEGRLWGSTLNICSIRSLATMSPDKEQGFLCCWVLAIVIN